MAKQATPKPEEKPNPNYPAKEQGKKSGKGRGNEPKPKKGK